MPEKDYSSTPLSKKLGAKPGAGVVVFFTTEHAELERRFELLRDTLDPADGLWIAWPKKASKLETDLDFDAVQQTGLDRRRLAGRPLRLAPRRQAASLASAADVHSS
jgi:hypothetical protein